MELNGKTVLLTGATGGIGHAIARHLHREGAALTITGRRTEVLEPLAAEIGATAMAVDLSDDAATEKLAEDLAGVDILVANAALPGSGDLRSFSVDEIDRTLTVNLRAPIILARVLGERMAARGSGHLVFTSSLSGKLGMPGSSMYSATKFGLRGFGQALRCDLRKSGVGVSVVFPGFISDAGMFVESGASLPRGVGTSTPDDVARAVLRAITANKGEIDVAPLSMRAGTAIGQLMPETSARLSRLGGSEKISAEMAVGQASKR